VTRNAAARGHSEEMDAPAEAEATSSSTARRRRRRRASRTFELREVIGVGLLATAVVGSALAFGAQHTPVLVVCALASAVSALLLAPARLPRAAWILSGLAAYTMLEVVPLPLGVVERLSPAAGAVWRGALAPLHASVSWATLSVDPAATSLEALKWSAYVCVLIAASGWRARRRAVMPAALVFGSALIVCVITLLHGLLGLKRVYGLFDPSEDWPWIRGPFVNGNNLAGYLNLGLFAGAGVWSSGRGGRMARPLALGVPVLATGVLISGSRAAVVALVLAAALFAALILRQRPGGGRALGATLVGTALVAVALAAAGAGARAWEVVNNTSLGAKAQVWRWSLGLVRDFPGFGVGRGAFETAFLPYRQPDQQNYTVVYAYAENFVVQWIADWGVPVGCAALVGCAILGRRALGRSRRNPLAAGLVAGLGALLLQNLADLGLELFAVSACALVAFTAADEAVEGNTERTPRPALPGAIAVAVWSLIVVFARSNPVQVDRQHAAKAYAALGSSPAAASGFDETLRALMLRHPGEAYFPLLGGAEAIRTGRDALPWFNRALERSPFDANAHLLLSDALARRGARLQSLLHSRLAAVYDGTLRDRALAQIGARVHTLDELRAAFPADLPGAALLEQVCDRLAPGLVVDCFREALTRRAGSAARLGLAMALVRAISAGAAPCGAEARDRCDSEALALLDGLENSDVPATKLAALRAELLSLKGQEGRAAKLLAAQCAGRPEAANCYSQAFDLSLRSRDALTLGDIANRYATLVCADPGACAALRERTGRAYLELAAPGLAFGQFKAAAEANPTAERWLLVAEAAAKAGVTSAALVALQQVKREAEPALNQDERVLAVQRALSKEPADE
jgi:tetratricopeptide (TPR) repeat protein